MNVVLRVFLPLISLCACGLTELLTPPTPTPTPTPDPNAWHSMGDGLYHRNYRLDGEFPAVFTMLRADPALYQFRVHYRPGDPLTIQQWREALPDALAFVNANFFDEANQALGLLVADSQTYSEAYTDRGGIFAIRDGQPMLYPSGYHPQHSGTVEQAIQAFPMLVTEGIGDYNGDPSGAISRRTVIALNREGEILILVTPLLGPSLEGLSRALAASDLEIVTALNLDGGGSTMLYSEMAFVPALDPVPAVLAIYPK